MKTLMERQMLRIMNAAPRETGFWTGTGDVLEHPASGGLTEALTALLAEEAQVAPAEGYSGFIIEMPGGSAIVIMAHTARDVELTLRTQGQANAVLFSLLASKFIAEDRIPKSTLERTKWGDVKAIRWFSANNHPVAQSIQLTILWPRDTAPP